jgi:hypothetical protein
MGSGKTSIGKQIAKEKIHRAWKRRFGCSINGFGKLFRCRVKPRISNHRKHCWFHVPAVYDEKKETILARASRDSFISTLVFDSAVPEFDLNFTI